MSWRDLGAASPELVLTVAALAVLLYDAWTTGPSLESPRGGGAGWLALAGVALAVLLNAFPPAAPVAFAGMYVRDRLTQAVTLAALLGTGITVLLSPAYLNRFRLPAGEYYALVLFSAVGAILMGAARNLAVLFLGLEILSFPLYTLAALATRSRRSQEAGLKYLLLGAFGTAFFVYGVALVYGAAGTLDLSRLAGVPITPLLGVGVALLTIGLGFEAALAPFHAWAPDVYEGAPLPATAIVTVIWGNLAALFQTNLKRLLAYSSIAHAGYMLIGIAAPGPAGTLGVLYYLVVYAVMNLGAFGVLILLERRGEEADEIADLAGLWGRAPWAAGVLALCMVSLAGLPPTGGFIAKLYLFRAALEARHTALALVAVLTSVVSVYYYLRVAAAALSGTAPDAVAPRRSATVGIALALAGAGVLWFGILPSTLTAFVQQAVQALR